MYDARGGGNANNGTIFAVALCGVIAAAFAVVVFWPSGSNAAGTQVQVADRSINVKAAFASKEEQRFANALKELDEQAFVYLEKELRTGSFDPEKRHQVFMDAAEDVAFDNINALAKSDVKHLDIILDEVIGGLQSASRSRAKLCQGATYASLEGKSQRQIEAFVEREVFTSPEVLEFGVKLNRQLLEAALDGQKNPKRYGALNAKDKRALDGLGMKLMTDPKIMRVLMAAGSSSNPEEILATLDICDLSVSVLRVVDRLPKDTKSRLWASTFAEIKKNGSFDLDPSGLSQLGGF